MPSKASTNGSGGLLDSRRDRPLQRAVVKNDVSGQGSDNPDLREWHTQKKTARPRA